MSGQFLGPVCTRCGKAMRRTDASDIEVIYECHCGHMLKQRRKKYARIVRPQPSWTPNGAA